MGTWRCWRCNAALVARPCPACQGTGRIVRAPEWTGETVLVFCQRCCGGGRVLGCSQGCSQGCSRASDHTHDRAARACGRLARRRRDEKSNEAI